VRRLIAEVEDGETGVVDVGARLTHGQRSSPRIRQRFQNDGVHDAEDGGVGANAERHGDGDGEGIPGWVRKPRKP
jgi:hypothetical protein